MTDEYDMPEIPPKVLAGIVAGFAGITATVIIGTSIARNNLEEYVKENPPSGVIGFSVDDAIYTADPASACDDTLKVATYLTTNDVRSLHIINEQEALYTARGGPDEPADHVYHLNFESGESTLLFNPYSARAKELIGDMRKIDAQYAQERKEAQEEMKKRSEEKKGKGSRIEIHYDNRVSLSVNQMHAENDTAFLKMNGNWYSMGTDGTNLQKTDTIPGKLRTNLLDGPNKFYLTDSWLGGTSLHVKGFSSQCNFSSDAENVMWYFPQN